MSDQRPMPPDAPGSEDGALRQAGASPLRSTDPTRIGPYVPLGRLGSGGMGHVYLARPGDGSPGLAAVKVIRPEYAEDPRFRRRFEREAAVHARVHTSRTPELLGRGFDDSLLWMATQYLPGLNLADAVRECGTLAAAGVWRLVAELGQALSALAGAGVVHRDLKPSNVILALQGAYVIDFGIARAADSSAITSTGNRVGTPAFMAPEYLREGSCDSASDVFSLAGSLIYAATGRAPFGDGTGVDVMHRVAFEEPRQQVMAGLAARDAALAALLSACLSKDPVGRPTPQELTQAASAAGYGHAASWHEPLADLLLARRQACEVLEGVAVPNAAPEAVEPGTRPQDPASPDPGPAPGPDPDQVPTRTDGGGRGKRRVYLAVAAALALCAVAAGTFLLTRPPLDGTDSAAAKAVGTAAPADVGDSPPSSSSNSPSGDEDEGREAGGKEGERTAAASAEASSGPDLPGGGAQASPADGTSGDPDPDADDDAGSAGGTTAAPSPTGTATTPDAPPWLSRCTYYSGTELTVRGDQGQRVVQVQCMLTERGYGIGGTGVDGRFGGGTLAAVKRFQGAKGLAVDGEVGPDTWAALRGPT